MQLYIYQNDLYVRIEKEKEKKDRKISLWEQTDRRRNVAVK
jgi:hypothetical protein